MNSDPLFSENWFRIKDLKPRLAVDVGVRRHVYRRVPWYVLYRASTGTYHRVDARAFQLVGNLDGTVTVDALWKGAIESQGADAPTQANLMDLLAQLHEADLLTIDRRLNAEQLFQRRAKRTRADVKQRYLNPLYLRFPIFDPDRMLDWLGPLPRLLFSKPAYFAWVGLLLWAMTQLAPRTSQLYHEFAAFDFLSAVNGFTFFVVYPLIKMLHELAHGLAVKRYGGEVHELGLALMVLLPIPYVDASAAAIFPDKRHRMMVGAAGIMVELGVAAVAALIWSAGEPGQIHDVAFMIMMIGGISTVVFNGNPLLKFDGYYVLADALEIPNLAERSKQFVLGKLKHRLFGLEHAAIPAGDRRRARRTQRPAPNTAPAAEHQENDHWEGVWLVTYGVTSTLYRLVLMSTIAFMLFGRYFFFGVALALWVAVMLIGLPIWRFVKFIATEPGLGRGRAVTVTGALAIFVVGMLGWMPIPLNTVAKGVVWLPENAIVRTSSPCEVTEVFLASGTKVQSKDRLFRCEDDELNTKLKVLQAQIDEVAAERAGLRASERVERQILDNRLATARGKHARALEQHRDQLVLAQSAGEFVVADEVSLIGRYLRPGDIAAYIVPPAVRTIRIAVEQADVGTLASGVERIEVRFADSKRIGTVLATRVVRQTPKAGFSVPSPALTTAGGGDLVADMADPDGRTVMEPVFDLELAWPEQAPSAQIGGHVRVKFVHPSAPVAERLITRFRRAFLGQLDV